MYGNRWRRSSHSTIQKATGVPLAMAAQPEKGKLTFGATHAANVPAWEVMEALAIGQAIDGKWEKVGDGYVLHAKPGKSGLTLTTPEEEKAKKVIDDAVAKQTALFHKFHPLGADSRLHGRFNVEERPKLADLLGRMSKTSQLKFTLAENLTNHDPNLGVVSQPASMAVYMVMEFITDKDLDNGQWEKIDGGYILTGTSKMLPPPPAPPPGRFPWAWAAVVLAGTLIGVGAFVMYRSRGKKTAANLTTG
jgi:hypothetical protein